MHFATLKLLNSGLAPPCHAMAQQSKESTLFECHIDKIVTETTIILTNFAEVMKYLMMILKDVMITIW